MRPIGLILLAGLLTSCGSIEDAVGQSTTTTTASQLTTTTEVTSIITVPEGFPEGVLADILNDAADRSGVPAAEIGAISIEPMTFSDASLGCPEPGKMYAQVITPGFVVLLQAAGERLDYRLSEKSGEFTLCD